MTQGPFQYPDPATPSAPSMGGVSHSDPNRPQGPAPDPNTFAIYGQHQEARFVNDVKLREVGDAVQALQRRLSEVAQVNAMTNPTPHINTLIEAIVPVAVEVQRVMTKVAQEGAQLKTGVQATMGVPQAPQIGMNQGQGGP